MSKWIPVEERLPEKQMEVVFYSKPFEWQTGMFTPDGYCGQEGDVFQWHDHRGDDCFYDVDGVTHWMPLPDPPGE